MQLKSFRFLTLGSRKREILKNAVSSEAFKEVYQKLLQSGDAVAASWGHDKPFRTQRV